MNTIKDMKDTVQLMQDNLEDMSMQSAHNQDILGEEIAETQKLLVVMRMKLQKANI